MRRRGSLLWELLFATLAALAAAPLWGVLHPPIQDLPQHLAAIRVLHDYSDPALGFQQWFEIALGQTQYLAYYLAAHLLSYPLGVQLANRVLMTAAIVGTPYALRALLRALGRDEGLALLCLPLTFNAHLILGFLNFVAAIPLMFLGLALAVRYRVIPSRRRAIGLSVVAVIAFYTHVVPFAFMALGVALVAIGDSLRDTLKRWLPLVPATIAALVWAQLAPAGRSVLLAASITKSEEGPKPHFEKWDKALADIPKWLTDVLHHEVDDKLLILWGLLLLLIVGVGVGARLSDDKPSERQALQGQLARRLGLLAPLAAWAYFVTPSSYDWIWPINARFPLLALLLSLPVLPPPGRVLRLPIYAAAIAIALQGFWEVDKAFKSFEQREVGELEQAIAAIPPGQKVAGLVWDRGSRYVKFSPMIHSVAWYQVRRGGAVMFTFADFPQSPIVFRDDNRPPRVPPRWEWMPERVSPERDLAWFDYVLTRGGPGRIARSGQFERVFQSGRWAVYRRRGR